VIDIYTQNTDIEYRLLSININLILLIVIILFIDQSLVRILINNKEYL